MSIFRLILHIVQQRLESPSVLNFVVEDLDKARLCFDALFPKVQNSEEFPIKIYFFNQDGSPILPKLIHKRTMQEEIRPKVPKLTRSMRRRPGPKWVPPTDGTPKIGITPILAKRVNRTCQPFSFSFPKQAQSVIPFGQQSNEKVPNFEFSPPKSVKPTLIRPPKKILTKLV